MNDEKFRLSKNYIIVEASKTTNDRSLADQFIIISKVTKRFFLVNPSIKTFVDFFREPSKVADVLEIIRGIDADLDEQSIKNIKKFFIDLCRLKILIPENSQLDTIVENKEMPAIDGYTILKVFKKRHNIIICSAIDHTNSSRVVLKCLRLNKNISEKHQNRIKQEFIQEFDIMKEVSHPLVCKLLEFNEGRMLAVLEHVEGETLKNYILAKKPTIQYKIQIITKLLKVFSYLHTHGILHGDIHPSNFIINDQLDFKLIDFGLANHEQKKGNELIKTGGVFYYIPPERLSNNAFRIVNKIIPTYNSEVYQLGAVIFFIIYGTHPFNANTWKNLTEKIKCEIPTYNTVNEYGEIVPKEIIEMIETALNKDPNKRFQSANALLEYWEDIRNNAFINNEAN